MRQRVYSLCIVIALILAVTRLSCGHVPESISPLCSAASGVCQAATAICNLISQDTTSAPTLQLAQKDLETKLYELRVEAMRFYTQKHRSDSIQQRKQ